MANSYIQIHLQIVFAVQNRMSLINEQWENRLYQYIVGIIQNYKHKVLAINGMPDHIHIAIGYNQMQLLPELMQITKRDSSIWINKNKLVKGQFSWQAGYGAFAYRKSDIPQIINYILNQKEHHKNRTFIEEYKKTLRDLEIEFDERYIFKPFDD